MLISHSSGTTGMPKGVPHTHRTLMYAQLHRLRYSTGTDMARTLVGLPGAHNAMVATLLYCLLLRTDIKLLSSQRGARRAGRHRGVRGRPPCWPSPGPSARWPRRTWRAVTCRACRCGSTPGTRRTRRTSGPWWSTAATRRSARTCGAYASTGSVFVDGLGSSEAGYSVFHNRHTKDTSAYSRCVGKPISFAEAAVLAEDGTPLPPGRIGRLGLKSPTLTPGYWNDSLTWNRMRLGGYWLTGDLAHQDEEGNFYHLDRAPDAIRTRDGILFSTRTEELLLRELPELADCTVVGVAPEGVRADWDGDGEAEAYALLQLADGARGSDGRRCAGPRGSTPCSQPPDSRPVTRALRMKPDDVAKGATGKVLKRVMRDRFAARGQV